MLRSWRLRGLYKRAAEAIRGADALLIGAGAGMGVDSGLPDFRGAEGFWKAYPPFKAQGLEFHQLSTPRLFREDPELAWGYFGHRLQLYRDAAPHEGYQLLREWGQRPAGGHWVFTSNVDGQFLKAGFDPRRLVECHGSIHHLQCTVECTPVIWPEPQVSLEVDMSTIRARGPLPDCPACGRLARPNVLMFGDGGWISHRTFTQEEDFDAWLREARVGNLVAIECGAGTAIPTVRMVCQYNSKTLIRINPRESEVREGSIGLPVGALEGLRGIAEQL